MGSPHPCDQTLSWSWGFTWCGGHHGQLGKLWSWHAQAQGHLSMVMECGKGEWLLGLGAQHTCMTHVSTSVGQLSCAQAQSKAWYSLHDKP